MSWGKCIGGPQEQNHTTRWHRTWNLFTKNDGVIADIAVLYQCFIPAAQTSPCVLLRALSPPGQTRLAPWTQGSKTHPASACWRNLTLACSICCSGLAFFIGLGCIFPGELFHNILLLSRWGCQHKLPMGSPNTQPQVHLPAFLHTCWQQLSLGFLIPSGLLPECVTEVCN